MKRQGVGRGFDIRDVRSWKRDLMGTIQCIFLITSLSMPCSVTLFLDLVYWQREGANALSLEPRLFYRLLTCFWSLSLSKYNANACFDAVLLA